MEMLRQAGTHQPWRTQRAKTAVCARFPCDAQVNDPRGKNVTLWPSTQAIKLLFAGTRVLGVDVLRNGFPSTATARKEVIVSGGAQNSPKLLLLR